VYAFVIMSNHLHVVLKTPEPNLARGMQGFLSAYANAWSRRHRFNGHVFQGRYLARRHTAAMNGELTANLGVSRAESVPNLTRRFYAWLSIDARVRKQWERLELELTSDGCTQ
jgi:hypothetical protein